MDKLISASDARKQAASAEQDAINDLLAFISKSIKDNIRDGDTSMTITSGHMNTRIVDEIYLQLSSKGYRVSAKYGRKLVTYHISW